MTYVLISENATVSHVSRPLELCWSTASAANSHRRGSRCNGLLETTIQSNLDIGRVKCDVEAGRTSYGGRFA